LLISDCWKYQAGTYMSRRGDFAGNGLVIRFPERAADFLLVGGGLASATAAETLRLEGAEGSVVIVSAEDRVPYHRPPLSGRLKLEEAREPPPVLKEEDYRARGIELLCGVRAVDIDPERHLLRTDRAGTLTYGKLLIATGATPVRLQVPGADLRGIHYLRTANDARAIQDAARKGRRCVVIGAGFIGMEVSSALRLRGLDVQLVAGEAGIFAPLRDREIAEFFESLYADKGIPVLKRVVAGFEGDGHGAVEAVVLEDGQRLPCDFVVAGIGVHPDTDWLSGSGIAVDDGVVVDRDLMASVPDVYAAGDVASFFDPVFNLRRRIEHWDNAVKQGRLAARNMLGQRLPYDEVSGFFCQAFDVNFQFAGRAEEAPRRRSLGSPHERAWARLYLKDSVPRALFTMGRPARETAAIQALIRYRTNIEHLEQQLGRPGFVLADIPTQNVLVLQGGGALGAFECGVVRALEEAAIHPDVVAGVSIGAFNGAIIAAHPRHASEALDSFWRDLAIASPAVGDENARKLWSSTLAMLFGVPGFFTPRWWPWSMSAQGWFEAWVSLYDHSPVRKLLRQYVDFEGLKASPVRLLVTAVNVETAQLEVFDSYVDDLTPDHLLASGSLPPGLPWTTIGARHYWDGGIVSNSPLEQVTERCGTAGKRVVVVDLFPHEKPLPTNLMEVLARRDEIVYAERIRRAGSEQALLHDARKLIESVLSTVNEATAARIRQLPPYVQVMGAPQAPSITRIIREGAPGEPAGRDFDFSLPSIEAHMKAGLEAGRRALQSTPERPAATGAQASSLRPLSSEC
jgi:NADPH-dependent 2,4-dienoyl-CoA reductase/sulfur reductase-like enzyme/predicted acylesterase/phospholipase RssA